jgi:hypothetical protein
MIKTWWCADQIKIGTPLSREAATAMSNEHIANLGRQLARALNAWAKSRAPDDLKDIALLHTALCRAVRDEAEEAKNERVSTVWE